MQSAPSNISKTYPRRGPLQQFRFAKATGFSCLRCNKSKKSKLITVYCNDWSKRLCNGCYGRLLSIYDVKAGTDKDDYKADKLAEALLSLVGENDQTESERLYRASESRASKLTNRSVRFIATAEFIAKQLDADPQLEWSPAIIGLCKAVESEVIVRVCFPLVQATRNVNLTADRKDKDIGRLASYCFDNSKKPPELGTLAHFFQTVAHSKQRRETSPLVRSFLSIVAAWKGSGWILDPEGLHNALVTLTVNFRNKAAHLEELGREDYLACRELVIGNSGLLWTLLLSTEK